MVDDLFHVQNKALSLVHHAQVCEANRHLDVVLGGVVSAVSSSHHVLLGDSHLIPKVKVGTLKGCVGVGSSSLLVPDFF